MRISTQQGIAPLAALIIALLVIGGGAYGVKKLADKKKTKTESPAVETTMPVPETETPERLSPEANETRTGTPEMIVENIITEPTEITVTYGANGFMPKTVTIKKGDMVVFENKTGKPASVASAVHPTHLLYPEFDQYKTDQRGKDEFRFIFENAGTWKYHDHLNSTMTGIVIVE